MGRKQIYILLAMMLVMAGCKTTKNSGQKPVASGQRTMVSTVDLETEAMMIEAKMNQELDQTEKAVKGYQTILTRNPNFGAALYELASMYKKVGMVDSALYYSQKAENIDKSNQWYKLQLAALYHAKGDYKSEIKTWEALIKLNPDKLDYYYELSNAYLADGNVEGAIEPLNRVEKMIGVTEPISLQKQKLWTAVGKNEKAVQEIEKLADALPQEKKYSELMAELYMKQKNYAKAKKYYDQIAAADPTDEYIHISLANYYHQTGDEEATYRELKQGLRSEALNCADKVQIISSIYTVKEFYDTTNTQAFALLEETIDDCYDTMSYAPLYGEVLMNRGRWREAAEQFSRYLKLDTSRYEIWEAYLICLSVANADEDTLMGTAKRTQALFPFQSLPYFMEGQHYVIKQEYEKAEKPLVQCVKLGFNNGYIEADTYGLLAEVYYRQSRQEEAWQCFEKSLKASPDNIPTLNNYAYYLSETSTKLEKAEQMSKRTIIAEPENPTYLDTYAWILYKMGRAKEALPYMEKAVKNDKEGSETLKGHLEEIRKAVDGQ
ncbi:MAG: tetratricopeptide repeat protein [Bacteroidales bacterium]|nr:tetratricopeptide repeat protein [Bacteroidales bacterium]